MAHFAKIENGKVTQVIAVKNEDCGGGDMPASESVGQTFIASVGLDGEWVQTSYNRNFRGCFAGIGMNWDGTVFYRDQPFTSWTLNSSTGEWEAPSSPPNDGGAYSWDEASTSWVSLDP